MTATEGALRDTIAVEERMQPAIVQFTDQRVVFDRTSRAPFLVRISGQFVGYGVEPHEVPTMQQWLGQAAFHALDRFVQPLSDLPKQVRSWSAEVSSLVAAPFAQHFRAQGAVEIVGVEVLPAPGQPAQQPRPAQPPQLAPAQPISPPVAPAYVPPRAPPPAPPVNMPPVNVAPVHVPPPPPPPAVVVPVVEPVSEGPRVEHDPWELELASVIDPPTNEPVRPLVVVVFTGTSIAAHHVEAAKKLASECVLAAIQGECAQGRSVLDLLLFASNLDAAVNKQFEPSVVERARARGSLSVREVRLNQEDAARLRDLYGQIAAARGA